MSLIEINNRYSGLAETECCLSCGNALMFAEPLKGETCVDLGSGRGTDVIRMAEKVGKEGFVYGIDISEGMLKKAILNAEKLGVKNVKFLKNELENIQIKDQTVDLIISNCTINHAGDKFKVWSEIFRILKNNGRFVVSDIYSVQPVPEKFKNDPVAVSECWGGAITREEYFDILEKAGFKNITILEESKPYHKGEIEVSSFTIAGTRKKTCNCNS